MTVLRRQFQAAQAASASIDFNLDEPGTSPIRVIDFASAVMGDAGNEEIVEAVFDPVDWDFKDRAAASIDGFASYAAFEWGGRDFALEADSKGFASSALSAVFNSLPDLSSNIEASMDGFAARGRGTIADFRQGDDPFITLVANTNGAAGDSLNVLFQQQGANSALVVDTQDNGNTVRVRAGRSRAVTTTQLVSAINALSSGPITATAAAEVMMARTLYLAT